MQLPRVLGIAGLGLLLFGAACQTPSTTATGPSGPAAQPSEASAAPADLDRMAWWREARFGLFIHWGLYSVLEGAWQGDTGHAEWIRTTAQIPRAEYAKLQQQFHPRAYDPDAWCRMAKAAGMKYVVITTKHHDGFCLWPSALTDFDVEGTPAGRDLLGELASAARRHGLRLGWYHSIMDWNHPDYLPRRGWETERSTEGADFGRYVEYLRGQVGELLTNYGPIDVMWFDGEWETTWTSGYGRELYALCRELQPAVIVNNRVDKGRAGMAGLDTGPGFVGDFGTPEQEVPAGGLPGVDWETCMTMNRYWGWNRADTEWKSSGELIRTLADVASKGGNFLLNVGPRPDGSFPEEAVTRLAELGSWMDAFGESIHGTEASPFPEAFPWGRATLRRHAAGRTTLYLHVFDWPTAPQLLVPGLASAPESVRLLGVSPEGYPLGWQHLDDGLQVFVPKRQPHPAANVIALEFAGPPVIDRAPEILAADEVFLDELDVTLNTPFGLEVRYTLDGSEPQTDSLLAKRPLRLRESTTVTARSFRDGRPVAAPVQRSFTRLRPIPSKGLPADAQPGGLRAAQWPGIFDQVPEPSFLAQAAQDLGRRADLRLEPALQTENQCLEHQGWLRVPREGFYRFRLSSDDGSKLWLADQLVVDNDGLHGAVTREGALALEAGWHPIRVLWFNRTGSALLDLQLAAPGEPFRRPAAQDLAAR